MREHRWSRVETSVYRFCMNQAHFSYNNLSDVTHQMSKAHLVAKDAQADTSYNSLSSKAIKAKQLAFNTLFTFAIP